ncbi:hypothetical protein ebA7271 [Aromatoleum aromaticum EbN1]|uniref:Uncharacterized protein n=1 Tax=Aromatoleum aromaticum (strain DSM 19018 / LMG 30748 / EbN1) TaxID=76114 RepID=Q5NXG9_AROAE|nr:hypothetical protein ebA7271 [Aromatoleum aromaticum EbN1]
MPGWGPAQDGGGISGAAGDGCPWLNTYSYVCSVLTAPDIWIGFRLS